MAGGRRWLALVVLAFVAFLYYRPSMAYRDARAEIARRGAEVEALQARKRMLERRLRAARRGDAIAREARRLAYVRPGERLFIVKGIGRWRHERALERGRGKARVGDGG